MVSRTRTHFLPSLGAAFLAIAGIAAAFQSPESFDVILRNGTVYDGTGAAGRRTDVGLRGDRIAAVGDLSSATARATIDASGLAVAPGFINMLSWSTESLLADGRSQGEIRQGVTTQIMGEGDSMGPLTAEMKRRRIDSQGDFKFAITWTTLSEYLEELQRRGVAQNVASFVGATTIREHVIGLDDRKPTADELDRMRALVRQEMEAGALGVGSSLIYAPAFYATTEELIELCKVASEYRGKYISHMRSEGNRLLEAVDELIRIAREARIPAEIYHLKAAGERNWPKMDNVIAAVEAARREGLKITADMYTYPAGSTGLDAAMPPWALDGGYDALYKRLRDPATRKKLASAIITPSDDWENLYLAAGSPDRVLLVEFRNESLRHLTGKTLAEAARIRKEDPIETILNLVLEDQSRVGTVYFMMSEENVRKQIRLPWVSFGSDAASMAPEGLFLKSATHPRAYGNFARLLGKYVREEKVTTLPEAIRRLTSLPASNLELDRRGLIQSGHFADIAVFDPAAIGDRATFEKPHQYSVGMKHVFVNGIQVLKDSEHTGATPGRAVWGIGRKASWPGLRGLRDAGAKHVTVVHTKDRKVADSDAFVRPIREAAGVWMSGGRHWRIADAYLHTRTHKELAALLDRGGVVGGTSAGATIQGSFMVRGDTKGNALIVGDHVDGFGFLKSVTIDQHVLRRNRQFDLVEVIRARPELLGVGIDENTAIVVRGDSFEVIGDSYVLIYDHTRRLDSGGEFYFLAPGDRYNLKTREAERPTERAVPIERIVKEPWKKGSNR